MGLRGKIRLDSEGSAIPPPEVLLAAASRAFKSPSAYGEASPQDREHFQLAANIYYEGRFDVRPDAVGHILPVPGVKLAVYALSRALLSPGDVALVPVPAPGYYVRGARMAGAETFVMPALRQYGGLPDLSAVPPHIRERARVLWLHYPNNPIGAVAGLDFYHAALEFCAKSGMMLCLDNAYAEVTYEGAHAPSILEIPGAADYVVELLSLSATCSAPAWQMGVASGCGEVLERADSVLREAFHLPAAGDVRAASDVLEGIDRTWIESRNFTLREQRDIVISGLSELELEAEPVPSTPFVWAAITEDDCAYTQQADAEAGVILAPGSAFGAPGFIRISLGIETGDLREALSRLKAWHHRR